MHLAHLASQPASQHHPLSSSLQLPVIDIIVVGACVRACVRVVLRAADTCQSRTTSSNQVQLFSDRMNKFYIQLPPSFISLIHTRKLGLVVTVTSLTPSPDCNMAMSDVHLCCAITIIAIILLLNDCSPLSLVTLKWQDYRSGRLHNIHHRQIHYMSRYHSVVK